MLTKSALTMFSVFFVGVSSTYSQWEWLHPLPQGNDLLDVFFIDDSFGWCVGKSGTIVRTTDGGDRWSVEKILPHQDLRNVFFTDSLYGWIISKEGSLYHTVDGGESWVEKDLPESYKPREIFFSDSHYGWLVGDGNRLLRTDDGGKSWSVVQTNSKDPLYTLYALDSQKVWAAGDNLSIVFSPNGGKTWLEQHRHKEPSSRFEHYTIDKLYMLNSQYGWGVGAESSSGVKYGIVYGTTDGGLTWERLYREYNTKYIEWFSDVHFINRDTGWVIGEILTVNQTTDGGKTWKQLHYDSYPNSNRFLNPKYGCNGMSFVGNRGWIVSDLGIIYSIQMKEDSTVLEAASTHFASADTSMLFKSVSFRDSQNGIILGENARSGGHLYRTSDGGKSLKEIDLGDTGLAAHQVFVLDDKHLWVSGYNGWTGRSTDNGLTWEHSEVGGQLVFTELFFNDPQHGWGVGRRAVNLTASTVMRTSNGGKSWTPNITVNHRSTDLFFYEVETGWKGWLTADDGWLFSTENGGLTWDSIQLAMSGVPRVKLNDVYFVDRNHGWIVGGPELIFRTEDGGASWQHIEVDIDLPYDVHLHQVKFVNRWQGWIVGDFGTVLSTSDGGDHWIVHDYFTHLKLLGFDFINPYQGWVVGENGLIAVTGNNGGTSEVVEQTYTLDERCPVSVYPNVIEGEMSVRYCVEKHQRITMYVVDYLGRRIQTVLDQYQPKGTYSVQVDIEDLMTGIYYLIVVDGDVVRSQTFFHQ